MCFFRIPEMHQDALQSSFAGHPRRISFRLEWEYSYTSNYPTESFEITGPTFRAEGIFLKTQTLEIEHGDTSKR